MRPRGERHPGPGRPAQPYRNLHVGGKDVVDVWGALGEGIRLWCASSSPAPPGSSTATSSRSCSRPGHDVVGVDNFSKYGRLTKSYDDHPRYRFVEGDAKDTALLRDLAADATRWSPRPR